MHDLNDGGPTSEEAGPAASKAPQPDLPIMSATAPICDASPYRKYAVQHLSAGYSSVPLPHGRKAPPPEGWTGARAPMASRADVETWREVSPGANIGARLPDGVIALDVDAYDGKPGAVTLATLEAELGPLPASPYVTSRGATSPSRKTLYRLPPATRLRGEAGAGIEVLQHHHRYLMAPGSLHPAGEVVRAYRADGTGLPEGCMPHVGSLAELPAAWLAALRAEERAAPAATEHDAYDALLQDKRQAVDRYVAKTVQGLLEELRAGQAWAEHYVDAKGRGWEKLAADVAWELGKIARATWNGYTVADAEAAYLAAAPSDATWTAGKVRAKWLAQCHRGDARPWPAALDADCGAGEAMVREMQAEIAPAAAARPEAAAPSTAEREDGAASASTMLVRLAEERYTFGQSAEGEPFALPKDGPRVVRMLRGGQDSLRAELSEAFYRRLGKAPSQSALADSLSVLDGIAARATPVPLALRVAQAESAYWLDLGDSTGRAVRVAPGEGWEVRETAPVLFRRTPLTGALHEPARGGSLGELWEHLNVSAADRAIVAAILVAALVPDIPHVVVVIDGEQGAGKSTGTKRLAGLIDPSPVQLRRPPTNLETWTTAAAGSWVVAVDNVSTLQPWLSDALCRASTGDGDVQRRLYTNGDLYVVAFRRCVILNGIDLAGIRDDLADRAVTVHLERLTGRYRDDAELAASWAQAHPRILGALLDLASQVLALRHTVALADPPRMVDFARILAAVDSVLGADGITRYRALATDLAADAVMADPVLAAIDAEVRSPWTGTAGDLLDLLSRDFVLWDRHLPRDWPKDARAMSSLLRRRAPSLRRLGWEIEDLGRGGKDKQLRWRLTPPLEAGIKAGIGGHRAASAGITTADARQGEDPPTCENGSPTSLGGHGGRQDARFSLLNSGEEAGEAAAGHTYGQGADTTPAMPASDTWEPFAEDVA
jgi:hypothetical protein